MPDSVERHVYPDGNVLDSRDDGAAAAGADQRTRLMSDFVRFLFPLPASLLRLFPIFENWDINPLWADNSMVGKWNDRSMRTLRSQSTMQLFLSRKASGRALASGIAISMVVPFAWGEKVRRQPSQIVASPSLSNPSQARRLQGLPGTGQPTPPPRVLKRARNHIGVRDVQWVCCRIWFDRCLVFFFFVFLFDKACRSRARRRTIKLSNQIMMDDASDGRSTVWSSWWWCSRSVKLPVVSASVESAYCTISIWLSMPRTCAYSLVSIPPAICRSAALCYPNIWKSLIARGRGWKTRREPCLPWTAAQRIQ